MIKETYPSIYGPDLGFFVGSEMKGELSIHYHKTSVSIWGVQIYKEYRGKGLGQQLMKETVEFLESKYPEISMVYLYVATSNEIARYVYEKIGFKFAGYFTKFNQEVCRMELILRYAEDCFWTVNGNRLVIIDGLVFNDFLTINEQLSGLRKTPAQIYLESLGFSEEEAGDYLDGLSPKEK